MAEIVLTPAQQAVVEDRGGALLVSAAAGSGKTKVLVDRLLAQVCAEKDPADLDDFLIITYTKAAAAELRGKIAKELSVRLAQDGENVHLQRQLTRIYLAQISTVHAFCASLLRDYAHTLDIPADFRVVEEQEAAALRQEVLDALLEQCYQELTEDSALRPLIDTFGYGRDDRGLAELLLPTYDAVRCRAEPEQWMRACETAYDFTPGQTAEQTPWGAYLLEHLRSTAAWVSRTLCAAIEDMARDAVLQEKYVPKFRQNLELAEAAAHCETWDAAYTIRARRFEPLTAVRKPEDAELKERVQAARTGALEALKDALACFYAPSGQVMDDLAKTAQPIRGLLELLRRFDRVYAQEKRRRKLMDFSDLEHETIRLLCQKGTALPTQAAREIGAKYREILVDEYQDSNAVQERIFQALSRDGKNRFMVGDVKQSIYRFRLAEPEIFLEKYRTYAERGTQAAGEPRKILLSENFRSRPEILRAVNDVFALVMSREAAELDYGEQEALRNGRSFLPAPQPKIELHCVELDGKRDEDGQKAEKCEEEAAFVAARIARLLADGTQIEDGGALRPVRPGDIVILVHSPGSVAAQYAAALAKYRIACVTDRGGSILDTTEVESLCAILQILDNPHQDIPLAAAMASHVFAFTPEELAQARSGDRGSDLYDCLCALSAPGEKLTRFLRWLETERAFARQTTLRSLIDDILGSTGLEEIYASLPDGVRRAENLRAFRALAAEFEAAHGGDLMQFDRYLADLRASGKSVAQPDLPSGADAVRLMSIHKSKGLEFPVVVLADLSRKFNLQDSAAPVLLDDALLIGANVVDADSGSYFTGMAKNAIALKKVRQSVAEEMRVLYVAMTRAREMLIMTFCAARLTARLQKWNAALTEPVRPEVAASAICMGDWVLMAALARTESGELFAAAGENAVSHVREDAWKVTFQSAQTLHAAYRPEAGRFADRSSGAPDMEQLEAQIAYRYPYAAAARTASKLTATQLKGRTLDLEAAEAAEPALRTAVPPARRPHFRADEALTGREKGNATHLFMQFVRYARCVSTAGVQEELERLVRERFLTPRQAEAVDCERILRLFSGPFGKRILAAEKVQREFKFSILTDAGAYDAAAAGEQVMLQGVVDCFWEEDGALVLVDFKTDRVYGDPVRKTVDYTPQLNAYAQALGRIFCLPVKEKYLYFFDCDSAVEV